MDLLILISGNKEKLLQKHNLSLVTTVKIDEKLLSKPNEIKKIIKSHKYEKVFFGTIDLEFQRFQFFIFVYILIFCFGRGAIIDEESKIIKINLLEFIVYKLPLFLFEIIASLFVIIYYYFHLYLLHKKLEIND